MKDRSLPAGIPRIRRARGFRLYDMEGRRYLDLYRDGALLGHRGAGVLTVMKSALSQGLSTALPTAWEGRLVAAVKKMLPGWGDVRLYASMDRALQAAGHFLHATLALADVHDPALAEQQASPAPAALWRPLLPCPAATRVLLAQLPVTVCSAPVPVCFAPSAAHEAPPSDALPGFVLAAAVRGLAALTHPSGEPPLSDGIAAVERAIDRTRGWKRQGPYVRAVFPEPDYSRVHAEFLRAGVLLHPGYPGPSVLPGECSPGENKLLADLFARSSGG